MPKSAARERQDFLRTTLLEYRNGAEIKKKKQTSCLIKSKTNNLLKLNMHIIKNQPMFSYHLYENSMSIFLTSLR